MTDATSTHDYPVTVSWEHGRRGTATSPDGLPALTVATPPQFGGEAGVWSPEHLLGAAVASCYMTTFLAIAERSGLEVTGLEVPVDGALERGDDRLYRFTGFTLRPRIEIADEADRSKAERIAVKSEAACLITRSLSAPVELDPTIEVCAAEPFLEA